MGSSVLVCSVVEVVDGVLSVLERWSLLGVIRCMLLCMLEAVGDALCLLEVLKAMRCTLLYMPLCCRRPWRATLCAGAVGGDVLCLEAAGGDALSAIGAGGHVPECCSCWRLCSMG